MTYFANTSSDDPCQNCGRSQEDRPQIFRGEDWCSEGCREAIAG